MFQNENKRMDRVGSEKYAAQCFERVSALWKISRKVTTKVFCQHIIVIIDCEVLKYYFLKHFRLSENHIVVTTTTLVTQSFIHPINVSNITQWLSIIIFFFCNTTLEYMSMKHKKICIKYKYTTLTILRYGTGL